MAKTLERLEYLVRVVTTGFGFLVFTLMGLAFRFVACPLLTVFYRDPRQRVLKARWPGLSSCCNSCGAWIWIFTAAKSLRSQGSCFVLRTRR